jgi:acetyl esterase/lipase
MPRPLFQTALILLAAVAVSPTSAAAAKAKTGKVQHRAKVVRVAPNTGVAGSRCVARPRAGDAAAPGLDTTSLGSAAPAAYEIGAATSFPARTFAPARVMLFVHGGGWYTVGPGALATERPEADAWRAAGWETVNADYRACGRSIGDVVAIYDLIRARVGAKVPICVKGQSAGGHLALLLAAVRPDVACVIADGAPTDLWTMARQGATEAGDKSSPALLAKGAKIGFGLARAAFGRANLAAASPVGYASAIHARLLLTTSADDALVPYHQALQLADQIHAVNGAAYVDVDRAEPGPNKWVHGTLSDAAVKDYWSRTARLVRPFGTAPSTAPAPQGLSGLLGSLLRGLLGI